MAQGSKAYYNQVISIRASRSNLESLTPPSTDYDFDRAAELLRQLNMTQLEVTAYLGLLRSGTSTARSLSQHLGINRVDTYRVLKRLATRGLVNVTPSEPSLHAAVSPLMATRVLIGEAEQDVRRMKHLTPDVVFLLESLGNRRPGARYQAQGPEFRLLRGEGFRITNRDMILGAKSRILGTWSIRRVSSWGLIDPFVSAVRSGVRAQIICDIEAENLAEAEELAGIAELRHYEGMEYALRSTIVDDRELFLGCTSRDSPLEKSIGLWSDNEELIELFTNQFRLLWKSSQEASERLSQVGRLRRKRPVCK